MFQLAPVTNSICQHQLYANCDADKTIVFLCLVPKINDRFLEHRINIKFCVKSGRSASNTCEVLIDACGREKFKCS